MQIIPTILTADIKEAEEKLQKFKGIFEWVQLDIMDGVFVNNKTLLPRQFFACPSIKFFNLDIHLMVDNPLAFLPDCKILPRCPEYSTSQVERRVTGQIELMPDQNEFIQKTNHLGIRSGLAVDLSTPLENLNQNLLSELDTVLLMSVKAGWGGQKFQPQVLEKVKKLAKIKKEKGLNFKIALDGGINPENIKSVYQAGVEIFYVGSFLGENPKERLEELKKAIKASIQFSQSPEPGSGKDS